jgi:hypothetical protein
MKESNAVIVITYMDLAALQTMPVEAVTAGLRLVSF